MKKNLLYTALIATLASASAVAQTFNPQVVITNTYDGKVMEVQKQDLEMAVPDSLQNFDLAFDYSIFSNPYKGSYEFSPYEMNITPEPLEYKGKMLYLNAGAGYTLHPEAQLIFAPDMKGKFKFNIYDNFKGYFGNFRYIRPQDTGANSFILNEDKSLSCSGRDFDNCLGISGTVAGKKAAFNFDASYKLLSAADTLVSRVANAGDFKVGVITNPKGILYVKGDVRLGLMKEKAFVAPQGETDLGLSFTVGSKMGRYSNLQFGIDVNHASTSGYFSAKGTSTSLRPKYMWHKGNFDLGLGASFNINVRSGEAGATANYSRLAPLITPDVDLSLIILPGYLTLYASAKGGTEVNSYRSLMEKYHFIDPSVTLSGGKYLDYSATNYDLEAGFKGCISGKLQYRLGVGYGRYSNAPMESLRFWNPLTAQDLRLALVYADYNSMRADADLLWRSGKLEADLHFRYQTTVFTTSSTSAFALPAFVGGLTAKYNLTDQITFGFTLDGQSSREGGVMVGTGIVDGKYSVPGYIDLGVFGEYRYSSRISFWVKGANLLNNNIQKTVLYAQKGVWGTAGVSLNF